MSNGNRIPGRPPINDRFTGVRDPKLRADNPLYGRTKPIKPEFEKQRCESNARQMVDLKKTEAQRRFEAMRRGEADGTDRARSHGSEMVRKDRPEPQLRPGSALSGGVDRASFLQRLGQERVSLRRPVSQQVTSKEDFMRMRQEQEKSNSQQRDR